MVAIDPDLCLRFLLLQNLCSLWFGLLMCLLSFSFLLSFLAWLSKAHLGVCIA